VVTNLAGDAETRRIMGRQVAAFVDGATVPVGELGEALIEEFGATMLKGYVERLLVFQQAEERGVSVTEEELQERRETVGDRVFRQYTDRRGMTVEEMTELLDEQGLDLEGSKELLTRRLVDTEDVRATLLAEKMVADEVEVTEEDVEQAYKEHYGERFEVRQMSTESLPKARDLYQELRRGATFELVMRAEAGESGAWLEGLPLTTVTASHPYYTHVKDLEQGQVSGIFEGEGQYHIIKVVRHHPPAEHPPLESVREDLKQQVFRRKLRDRVRAFLVKLRAEADIRITLDQPENGSQVRQPG
jgi:parvulin-like peptidyl-prolyl isomerase